jgi:excisionase family DNA binding protein
MSSIEPLPHLRFDIVEAAKILRISRAALYERINAGLITPHKDGRRTFIRASELERYVTECRTQPQTSKARW